MTTDFGIAANTHLLSRRMDTPDWPPSGHEVMALGFEIAARHRVTGPLLFRV